MIKHIFFVAAVLGAAASLSAGEKTTAATSGFVPEGYELVWSDEFDEGDVPSSEWVIENWQPGRVNHELQTYTGKTVDGKKTLEVKDGLLHINCFKGSDGNIYSGRMNARPDSGWTYGYFEARINLPSGKGTWPAFWMMPVKTDWENNGWPRCGEIDILEEVGVDKDRVSSSLHTKNYNHTINTQKTHEIKLDGAEGEFHIYSAEWTPDSIVTYVDGKVQLRALKSEMGEDHDSWPFHYAFYPILNLAWGGDWGGYKGVDENALPATMLVDYVRIYQKPEALHQDGAQPFARVNGHDIIKPDGSKLFITGTNLGNWLNPEGYMFGFNRMTSPRLIDETFKQLVGPDKTAEFWSLFKDNYITKDDIDFIASTGANTIRLPFHYKLFTDEDYMGLTSSQDGFSRIDSVVSWCRANNLYLILDMHDAPGGQTGDNIDDSFGYPWLFESEPSQQLFCDIWTAIADRYKDEPVILGYELINEPIATHFDEATTEKLNSLLQPLQKRAVAAIRRVDPNHIIFIGAPQWNSNFAPLTDTSYDDNLVFTCHRYGGEATADAIRSYIDFRDNSGKPMYMGEIGHNTDQWQADFVKVMRDNNIGYTFWPYKKRDDSCMVGIVMPPEWEEVVRFAEAPHHSYQELRDAKPDREKARRALDSFIEASRFENCIPHEPYIRSIGLQLPSD